MSDYTRKFEDVPAAEAQNWPKGCIESAHAFMDLEISPIVERPYYHNEEIFYLYQLRFTELSDSGMELKAAQDQAKIELLPMIYPKVDILNFAENNPTISDQCCRLMYHMPLASIGSIHVVHGEGIKFYGCSLGADLDLNIPADPLWGFDLTKPEEGFPCINLTNDGCIYHPEEKPHRCKQHPAFPRDMNLTPACVYQFDEKGVRTGECNRCIG